MSRAVHGLTRIGAVAATLTFLVLGLLLASGLYIPLLIVLVLAWLWRRRARHKPVTETERLKLALLRARLVAADAALALKDPDIAQAAHDYMAGLISDTDYRTALEMAGRAAHERKRERAARFRFR